MKESQQKDQDMELVDAISRQKRDLPLLTKTISLNQITFLNFNNSTNPASHASNLLLASGFLHAIIWKLCILAWKEGAANALRNTNF